MGSICIFFIIGSLFLFFLLGVGFLNFLGKLPDFYMFNPQLSDFLSVWTLQVTFSTILLAVGGFLINFFNEEILGIPFSEITKKKGIWNLFLYIIISIILPVWVYLFITFYDNSKIKEFSFLLMLILLFISLVLSYYFICKVLNLLLNKEQIEKEIKQAIENVINEELKNSKESK